MGTLALLFETGEQTSQKGHFRNLVLLARLDGIIAKKEKEMLDRMARRLSLTEEQVQEILSNPTSYPVVPPVSREERYERLVALVEMAISDGAIEANEKDLLQRLGIALGFTSERLTEKLPLIIEKLRNGSASHTIVEAIL